MSYQWTQIGLGGQLPVALSPSANVPKPTFTAPSLNGTPLILKFKLEVIDAGDSSNNSATAQVTVYPCQPSAGATASSPGVAPAATIDVPEGAPIQLHGSGSDACGLTITYAWAQTGVPIVALLPGSTAQNPSFTAPEVSSSGATITLTLTTNNGEESSPAPATVNIHVTDVNHPPTAMAGDEQSVFENTFVTLVGGGTDPDGNPLTLSWTQSAGPTVTLLGSDTVSPTFTAPDVSAGVPYVDLTFALVVNDGLVPSGPSYVTIHVFNSNDPPLAVASARDGDGNQSGPSNVLSTNEGAVVTLDGTGSSDSNGDALTYAWTQLGTPPITLSDPFSVDPTFTAPLVGPDGLTLTFQLTVSDGELSNSTTVTVHVASVNHPPLADAGDDQTVPELDALGEKNAVTLDGTNSSDPDSDALSFGWVQTEGPAVVLHDAATAQPSFATPDVGPAGALLRFELTVNDGYGGSSSSSVSVRVTYINRAPTANAGSDETSDEGTVVALDGSGSDPDGNPLSYAWAQVGGPAVELSDTSAANPTFNAPAVTRFEDDVVFELSVDDGFGGSDTDQVVIHIANVNHAPAAQAPASLSVSEDAPVELIGQGSDPDIEEQSELSYAWQQIAPVEGPIVPGASLSFTAPLVTAGGDPNARVTLSFRLTVTDPSGAAASDDVDVVVTNVDHAPTAVAGGNLTANENASVTLNGSASSDPDEDPLSYSWVQTEGPAVALMDAHTAYPYFAAPFVGAAGATLRFQLTVDDGWGSSSSDTATVTLANINDPPTLTAPRASIASMWPPDHRMVQVSVLGVSDPQGNARIEITRVTQDEPTNGLGDGDTAIDAMIPSPQDGTALIRCERSGKGDGRVYRIYFTASDFEGSVSGVANVEVPKDRKGPGAIDSAPPAGGYDSTR